MHLIWLVGDLMLQMISEAISLYRKLNSTNLEMINNQICTC